MGLGQRVAPASGPTEPIPGLRQVQRAVEKAALQERTAQLKAALEEAGRVEKVKGVDYTEIPLGEVNEVHPLPQAGARARARARALMGGL